MVANFTTPEGRLVGGHPYLAQPSQDENGKPKIGTDGQPVTSFYVKLAIAKNNPEWPAFDEVMSGEARTSWPQFYDKTTGRLLDGVKFATKIADGDAVKRDREGKLYSERTGYAGCWIVTIASPQYAPTVFAWDETLQAFAVSDSVKVGDYVRVSGSTKTNGSAQSPGMYVNLGGIAKYRDGEAIGGGAQVTAASFPTPGQPATPAAPAASPAAPAVTTPASPTASPGSAPPPHDMGVAGLVPPPPAPPAGPVMLPAATATYEAYKTAGWTDDQLRDGGLMA